MPEESSSRTRPVVYVAVWLVAAALAVTVGTLAVTSLGASVRDRGPLVREIEGGVATGTPDPDAARQRRTFEGEYGSFDVECQGPYARGFAPTPATRWRTVSFEAGPDDDVDVIMASGRRSVELEVFCNGGVPELSDREVKTLPED